MKVTLLSHQVEVLKSTVERRIAELKQAQKDYADKSEELNFMELQVRHAGFLQQKDLEDILHCLELAWR